MSPASTHFPCGRSTNRGGTACCGNSLNMLRLMLLGRGLTRMMTRRSILT